MVALQVKANDMNELTLRDGRYDGIFHLVTAAVGAEEYYSLRNNDARSEPVELAREVSAGRYIFGLPSITTTEILQGYLDGYLVKRKTDRRLRLLLSCILCAHVLHRRTCYLS